MSFIVDDQRVHTDRLDPFDATATGAFVGELREKLSAKGMAGIQEGQLAEVAGKIERTLAEGPPKKGESSSSTKSESAASVFPNPQLLDDEIDGNKVFRDQLALLNKYLALPEHGDIAIALWIIHTFCFEAFPITPRLLLSSPEKRCGKTRALDMIALLGSRVCRGDNISVAAYFRAVDAFRPTVVIDEGDTFLNDPNRSDLVGVLNSGYQRNGTVMRCIGKNHDIGRFSTFGPAALAMINLPPSALLDRCIKIPLRRRKPGETISRMRQATLESECGDLRQRIFTWAAQHRDALEERDPSVPEELDDRAQDLW